MSTSQHRSLYFVGLTAAAALGGFVIGRVTSMDGPLSPVDAMTTKEQNTLWKKVQALEVERDALRRQLRELNSGSREAMPMRGTARPRPGGDPSVSKARGMGTAMDRAADMAPKEIQKEPPDPAKAAALLVKLKSALAAGESDTIVELAKDLFGQSELLVPELVGLLEQADSLFAMESLAQVLGEMGDKRALPALQTLLRKEASDQVRTAAVRALGRIPDPSSVSLLTAEFGRESSSPMPPSLAASALGNIDGKQAVTALKQEITKGQNRMVRAFAVRALAGRKDPTLVPFFLEQVQRKDVNERYRRQAIDAIAATGDKNAIWSLQQIALAPESGRALQESAKRAINKLAGQKLYEVR